MMATTDDAVPLEGTPVRAQDGWSIRLPVRAEEIAVSTQTVVRERVLLKRKRMQDVERVDAVLKREQLRTRKSGSVEVREGLPQNTTTTTEDH